MQQELLHLPQASCVGSGGGEKSQVSLSLVQPTTHHIREPMRSQLSAANGPGRSFKDWLAEEV